jgi:hypothetical protein
VNMRLRITLEFCIPSKAGLRAQPPEKSGGKFHTTTEPENEPPSQVAAEGRQGTRHSFHVNTKGDHRGAPSLRGKRELVQRLVTCAVA